MKRLHLGADPLALVGLALAVALLLAGFAVPADARRSTCSERGGNTLVKSSSVRVFKKGDDVYGCHRGPRRVFHLGTDYSPQTAGAEVGVRPLRIAGPLVGYNRFVRGRRTSSQSLRVRDLHNGRTLRLIDYSDPESATTYRRVTDLELSTSGSLAWILEYRALEGAVFAARYEVRGADGPLGRSPQAVNQLIDAGPNVVPESLTLNGDRLSWTSGGQTLSAPLR